MPPNARSGQCPACLLRIGLALGGSDVLAPLEELHAGGNTPLSAEQPKRVRDFGDYQILGQIGQGGMGVVYRARQVSLNRLVALKMIRTGEFANEEEVARFRTETEAAANLDHPNIATVYEVGEHEGRRYYSMKLVDGGSLAELGPSSQVRGPKPIEWAVRLVATVARAVHYAHQRGILHRDLKPGNILIDSEGQPQVTDFGLAKRVASDSSTTMTGAIIGTASYMAPEQASGAKALTTAVDIYSVGAILYELLTEQPPFCGATVLDTLMLVREREPTAPATLNPLVDRDLETICLKCLEKESQRRYDSAEALAEELDRWLRHEPIRARPVPLWVRVWMWSRRRPAIAGLGAVVLLVGLLGLAGILWQWSAARQRLWESLRDQGRSERTSSVVGRRQRALSAISVAARMHPSIDLRNEAIAALALLDLGTAITTVPPAHAFGDKFSSFAFDSDLERYAVSFTDGKIIVSRTADQKQLAERKGPSCKWVGPIFSPDGHVLAGAFSTGDLLIWDLPGDYTSAPRITVRYNFKDGNYVPATFSPDNRQLAASGTNNTIQFFETETGQELPALSVGTYPTNLSFSPDGEAIAFMAGYTVEIWDLRRRKRTRSLPHARPVAGIAWHPDGRHLSSGCDNFDLFEWDTHTGDKLVLPGHVGRCWPLFSPRGDLMVSSSWDGTSRFWDATEGHLLFVSEDGVATRFSRDGRRVACALEAQGSEIREVVGGEVCRTFTVPEMTYPSGLDFSPDGRWLAAGSVPGWRIWNVATGKEIPFERDDPDDHQNWPQFSPDGRFVLTSGGRGFRTWPVERGEDSTGIRIGPPQKLFEGETVGMTRAYLALDGGSLVGYGPGLVQLISLNDRARRIALKPFVSGLDAVAISPDNRWVAGATHPGSGVWIWDTSTGKSVCQLITNSNVSVAFSPDSKTLATCAALEYCFWDTGTWRARHRAIVRKGSNTPGPIVFSRDGKLLALAPTRRLIKLLDPQTGAEFASLTPPIAQNMRWLAISQDSGQLAAVTDSGSIQLWDLRALRAELKTLRLDW